MTFEEFLDYPQLEGVRQVGGGFMAICPAHEDRTGSLSIREGDDGRVLLSCQAGCETTRVVTAMGLGLADLFPNSTRRDEEPEAIYSYTDELGNTLFQAVRMPGKRFRQRHYEPDNPDAREDGWVWNLEGVRRVMYRLPELLAAVREGRTIYVVEGEKDADRHIAQTGRFTTCNPMGAGKWRPEYTEFFRGAKQVIIVQDRDEPGRRHAKKIKEELEAIGVPVLLMQARVGKDLSDHLDGGFTTEDLVRPRATPRRGIVTASQMAEAALEYLQYRPSDLPGWELLPGVAASTVRPGRLYAWGAYTGDGKTTAALQGTRVVCTQGVRAGYFSMEMSEADLRNRLYAHKGIPMWLLERPWELRQNPQMLALYHLAVEESRDWKLDIKYDPALKVETIIEDTIDREYEFVVLDHVHRLGFGDRRHLEEQIKMLTNLTLDANVPMLVLCQLRRYQRGQNMASYPPPVLQDFRETEVLGNEASIAAALWRQRDQEGLRYMGDASQFRVLKNRHTTSRHDKAGHIELLNFDTTAQLYTTGGIYSEHSLESPREPAGPERTAPDPWGSSDDWA